MAQVMILPQHLLAAPGASLAHQLAYPDPHPLPPAVCAQLLQGACLPHLVPHLQPLGGPASRHWGEQLSPGELQRLHLARVLLRRWVDGWVHRWVGGWVGGWMGGWVGGCALRCLHGGCLVRCDGH